MADSAQEFQVIEQIVNRLEDVGEIDDVLAALDFAGARRLAERRVSAVVYVVSDTAEGSVAPEAGAIQPASAVLAVTVAVPAPNDPAGSAGTRATLGGVIRGVRQAINGWKPSGLTQVLQWRSGRMVSLDGGRAIWEDRYSMHWVIDSLR